MKIKLGIIGTGRIAGRAVKEIREVKEIEITAVMNPNREHAAVFASRNGIPEVYDNTHEMAAAVDAVYVASPHGTHYEYSMFFLEKGCHVLCEKPLVFRKDEAEKLFSAAKERDLVLIEAVKTAYCPGFERIQEVIAGGVIGEVADVEAAFTRLTSEGGREYFDAECGGAFTEFGTYAMLPIFRLLGTEYDDVRFYKRTAGAVDGYTKAVFTYGDRFACAKAGLNVKSEGQLLVSGTKGYLLVPSPWWLTRRFEVRYEDPKHIDRYECEYEGDGLRYEFAELARRINTDRRKLGNVSLEKDGMKQRAEQEIREAVARAGVYEQFLKGRKNL